MFLEWVLMFSRLTSPESCPAIELRGVSASQRGNNMPPSTKLLFGGLESFVSSCWFDRDSCSDREYRTAGLEDSENLVTCYPQKKSSVNPSPSKPFHTTPSPSPRIHEHTSNNLDLGDSVGVTQDDTDLGRGGTLLGQLADLVDDLLGGGLDPRGGAAAVGDGRGRYSLSVGVKTTHLDGLY